MQFYIYLLLVLCIIFSTLSIFSNKFFTSIISFLLLITNACLIGIIMDNTLLSFIIFICYMTINCILILIQYYHNNNLDK